MVTPQFQVDQFLGSTTVIVPRSTDSPRYEGRGSAISRPADGAIPTCLNAEVMVRLATVRRAVVLSLSAQGLSGALVKGISELELLLLVE